VASEKANQSNSCVVTQARLNFVFFEQRSFERSHLRIFDGIETIFLVSSWVRTCFKIQMPLTVKRQTEIFKRTICDTFHFYFFIVVFGWVLQKLTSGDSYWRVTDFTR